MIKFTALNRKPTLKEKKLIAFLVEKANIKLPENWEKNLLVRPKEDAGMGGLYLIPNGIVEQSRFFSRKISEYQFKDKDGIETIAYLDINNKDNLFELDIWKTDFSPFRNKKIKPL